METKKVSIKDSWKTLDKIFNAGFNTDKTITSMTMEDLGKLPDLTALDMKIIIELKKAIKTKSIITFLSGYEEKIERKQ